MDITRQVRIWRQNALNEVLATKSKRKQKQLAREYYDIDQSSMNIHETAMEWPEMKVLVCELERRKAHTKRRKELITAKSVCNQVKYYKKAWLPTLEEFRDEYPFDPHDDLTEPSHNQNRNCGMCPKCLKTK
jgi:hypothetical protein